MAARYKIPDCPYISRLQAPSLPNFCHQSFKSTSLFLLGRIDIKEIKSHPWFVKNLPKELTETNQAVYYKKDNLSFSLQSIDEIMKIVREARKPPQSSMSVPGFRWGGQDGESKDDQEPVEEEEEEDEYESK
ncbi:Serine/threonine-protein kinase SRK2A [Sesamum alatum]|uniref:Serine/threonine-protein kinase SRK2A n=1 Tax=Sesamum alatum TaxID=300844 RepID=A0AAE1XRF4_9LAMI|nr:Serine/threonine-protein kinase SRK2A [Sesamum alatum]